jgi:L-seryl-tRNA(Ser) seleniumtransferase
MDARRRLPAIHRLVQAAADLPHDLVVRCAREMVEAVRAGAGEPADWEAALRERVATERRPHLRRVINATGVVLHTNLGRAPLAARALDEIARTGAGYANLELDLVTGTRGERLAGVGPVLRTLTGAEAALAVNNNAAAVLLVLSAVAAGREVLVSRGELVEIGGAFRVPEVIAAGGARLVEVGTTNRTRVRDYAARIGPQTAAILRVHPSNFRVAGFTEAPERQALATLARERGVPVLEDLGAGALVAGLGEPTVAESLATADLVTFSGDKLLGGPQAGLVVGREDLVGRARRHPLYRALRLDRLVLCALEATLRGYLEGEEPPAVAMLRADPEALRSRATAWAEGLGAQVAEGDGLAGGGSLPGERLPGWVVRIPVRDADAVLAALRAADPPVIARVAEGAILLDPRTVLPGEDAPLLASVKRCLESGRSPLQG